MQNLYMKTSFSRRCHSEFNVLWIFFSSLTLLLCCAGPVQDATGNETLPDLATLCVDRIIALDDSLGTLRNHTCKQEPLSVTIAHYAGELTALDFSDCPDTFFSAFKRHISAWEDMLPIVSRYPHLRGEMHDLFAQLAASPDSIEFKIREKRIWSTWREIEEAMKE